MIAIYDSQFVPLSIDERQKKKSNPINVHPTRLHPPPIPVVADKFISSKPTTFR